MVLFWFMLLVVSTLQLFRLNAGIRFLAEFECSVLIWIELTLGFLLQLALTC